MRDTIKGPGKVMKYAFFFSSLSIESMTFCINSTPAVIVDLPGLKPCCSLSNKYLLLGILIAEYSAILSKTFVKDESKEIDL